jgi:hypothetical protein
MCSESPNSAPDVDDVYLCNTTEALDLLDLGVADQDRVAATDEELADILRGMSRLKHLVFVSMATLSR